MSQTPDARAIQLSSSLDHVALARDFVAEIARTVPMNDREVYDLELAVTEALTNVVEHAYEGDETAEMELSVGYGQDDFTILITHAGAAFEPERHADPVMKDYIAERRVGGLGLYLIKKLMDEVEYTTDAAGKRQIRLVKRRVPQAPDC